MASFYHPLLPLYKRTRRTLDGIHIPGDLLEDQVPVPPCHIDKLSNDILVDQVFSYLDIFDILALRQVCKSYYDLSHHAFIWKKLLRWTNLPLPPLPPTKRYSFENLTGYEAERMMLRATSLDIYWDQDEPTLSRSIWQFNAHHKILSMVILPGSQYMVASVCNEGTDRDCDWAIIVFAMDGKQSRIIPLAKTYTVTKAYHLTARYTTINGVRSIALAYVRLDYKHKRDRYWGIAADGTDISLFSPDHDIDTTVDIKYECQVMHISLETLDALADPRVEPGGEEYLRHARSQRPPFRLLTRVRSSNKLQHPVIDEIYGSPYMAVTKDPNIIIFKNLNKGAAATMKMVPVEPGHTHEVVGMSFVPHQNSVLVFRRITVPPELGPMFMNTEEFFHVIPCGTEEKEEERSPYDWTSYCPHDDVRRVQFSTYGFHTREDDSFNSTYCDESKPPPPICMHAHVADGSIIQFSLFPKLFEDWTHPHSDVVSKHEYRTPQCVSKYIYPIFSPYFRELSDQEDDHKYLALPGSRRTLLYEVHKDDCAASPSIHSFWRIYDPTAYDEAEAEEEAVNPRPSQGHRLPLTLPSYIDLINVGALAWDETIGRLVIADEKSTFVWVVDLGKKPWFDTQKQRFPLPVMLDPSPDELHMPYPIQPPVSEIQPPISEVVEESDGLEQDESK